MSFSRFPMHSLMLPHTGFLKAFRVFIFVFTIILPTPGGPAPRSIWARRVQQSPYSTCLVPH